MRILCNLRIDKYVKRVKRGSQPAITTRVRRMKHAAENLPILLCSTKGFFVYVLSPMTALLYTKQGGEIKCW